MFQPKTKKNEIDKTTQNGCCDFCGRFKSQEEKKWRESFIFETSNKEKHGEGWELNVWDTEPS